MVGPARLPVIIRLLDREYGRQEWEPRFPPIDELVFTILSQNTTDVNAGRSLESLKARMPAWEDVAGARVADIADAIRPGGLADTKARYIQEALAGILAGQGSLDLAFLSGMADREAIAWLTRFRGIGVKTASCVLLFSLGRPVMPVDTHVYRVNKRLDFISEGVSRDDAHGLMTAITPAEDVYSFHVNTVTHGRRVCRARNPRCDTCVISALCPSEVFE
ncbi:MAG: endonuclease III [Gaiellales bacterium]|nr:MAG: endonuclease III [Gaiellales bacterium]